MKINYLFVLLALFSVVVFGCTQTATTPAEKKDAMMEKNSMEEKEMAEIGFEMKNGRMMMIDAKAKTESSMEKDATLNDGVKVMTNGKVVRKDGTAFMLKEGESMWMDGAMIKAGEMMDEKGMTNEGNMVSEYKGKVLAGTESTKYLDFNKADYDKALKENKKILLYFYASWCPICKKEQPETFAAFNEIKDHDLIGLRVNFRDSDTDADEEALAKQFGVSYQHTKVTLKGGQRAGKFPDSWDKQRYLDELRKI